jgi:hypothetical protein
MIKVHDDFFDKRWLDEISDSLLEAPWYANNIANADTWPYRKKGSHRLLGDCFFHRQTDNFIRYNSTDIELGSALINSFEQIQYKIKRKLKLIEVYTDLQFKGMDGTVHVDGNNNQSAFILMLSNEHYAENIGGGFYHQPTDTTIDYKYGRLIEITASDPHKGLSFNKPDITRFSVKYLGENI